MYLADLGAEVIKVERPGHGDDARDWGPPFVEGHSAWFASANRNKRSVVLDLRSEAGKRALVALVDSADVFLQNVNPAKLAHLGIDPVTVRSRNSRLIYCALSGFGLDGPHSALPGYDLVAQARSGLMSVTGEKGRSPQRVSTALSDIVTGMSAAIAITAAVVRQRTTGEGDLIDVALLDTDLALMAPRIASYHAGEPEPAPSGGTDSVLAVYQPFQTADRTIVVAVGNDQMWQRFCGVVDLPDLAADPTLVDNAGRRARRHEIASAVAERMAQRTAGEWLDMLEAAAVPCSLVQSLSEVVGDPQVQARGALLPVPSSQGRLATVHPPFRLESIGAARNERFPDLGADTCDVLRELGLDDADVDDLLAQLQPTSLGSGRPEETTP
jgi:crotonobetainyl-CoA:carnitine CoA-transferase CaiB-like acyl-CoA transferase